MIKKISFYLVAIILLISCRPFNSSVMFKTKKDYEFDQLPQTQEIEYRISPNDKLSFRLFTNNGFKIIDITTTSDGNQNFLQNSNQITYLVEQDGRVNLPMIGRVHVAGKTLKETEFFLEDEYDKYWIDPFVMLEVTNRRVTVFPGSGGTGQVILLENNNTTLIEALALAGGIAESGKAKKIKLIRGHLTDPKVYKIDLSTIDGLQYADIILQANDIIYVEPIGVTARDVVGEFAPVMGFITGLITLYFIIDRIDNN
mgnify:CR=1 FL=1